MKRAAHLSPRQLGVTLVELMVAIALSLVVIIALISVYLNVSRSNVEMVKTNSQIEAGRFASYFLQQDLLHAGFWGTYNAKFDNLAYASAVPDDAPTAVPEPCKAFASWTAQDRTNMLGIVVQAYDDVPAGCAGVVTNRVANTDVLVVRYADTCIPGAANCEALNGNKLYFQSSLNSTCAGAPAYPTYVLTNVAASFTLTGRDCVTVTPVRKFVQHIYWIRNYSAAVGDGIPTLVRSAFDYGGSPAALAQQPADALVEGVEGFRVELGIDSLSRSGTAVNYAQQVAWVDPTTQSNPTNRGDGTVDGDYVRCTTAAPCTSAQLANVVAVKVFLLVRAREASAGYTDGKTYQMGSTAASNVTPGGSFKRHLFTNTVRLANVALRRETP